MDIPVTDERLIAAIKEDSYVNYNKLFERYYARLCQYVFSMLKNKEDSEDVVQELFLNLWNNRKKIVINGNISAYLYKMAKNQTLNFIRSTASYRNLLENWETTQPCFYEENQLETDEFRIALFDCINHLPERSRQVLLFHRIKGLKQKEIAEKLTITVKTIKNQIWTSLQKLRKCLVAKGVIEKIDI